MARIRYTKTFFKEPGQISEEAYLIIKEQLSKNPSFEIDPDPKTFSDEFGDQFKISGFLFGLAILVIIILNIADQTDSGWLAIPVFSIAIGIGMIVGVFLEGPSFATYIKDKKNYFSRLKYAIQSTSTYNEFLIMFYSRR